MIAGDPSGVRSLVTEDFEVLRDTKTEASSLSNRSPGETLLKLSKTLCDRLKFHPEFSQEARRVVDLVGCVSTVAVA